LETLQTPKACGVLCHSCFFGQALFDRVLQWKCKKGGSARGGLTVCPIAGAGSMVQVVDYGTVPAARPQLTAKRVGFIRFAAVATLALGVLAAVIVVGQVRPGILPPCVLYFICSLCHQSRDALGLKGQRPEVSCPGIGSLRLHADRPAVMKVRRTASYFECTAAYEQF